MAAVSVKRSIMGCILPTMHYRSPHIWELLHPLALQGQHRRNNSQQGWELLRPFAHGLKVTLSWICLLQFYLFVSRYFMFRVTTYVDCRSWLLQLMKKFGFVFVRSNSEKTTNQRKNNKRKLEETEGKTFQSSQTNGGTELTETGSEDIRKRKKKQKNWKLIKLFWWIILDKFVYELFETLSWIVQATEKKF